MHPWCIPWRTVHTARFDLLYVYPLDMLKCTASNVLPLSPYMSTMHHGWGLSGGLSKRIQFSHNPFECPAIRSTWLRLCLCFLFHLPKKWIINYHLLLQDVVNRIHSRLAVQTGQDTQTRTYHCSLLRSRLSGADRLRIITVLSWDMTHM